MRLLRYHCTRWLLTESRFHRFLGICAPVASLIYAWNANRADVFARSGSIMCLCGGFLSFRRYLRGAETEFLRDTGAADQPAFGILDPMTAKMQARASDFMAMGWGIWLIVVGTAIWGYGDVVLRWLHVCH